MTLSLQRLGFKNSLELELKQGIWIGIVQIQTMPKPVYEPHHRDMHIAPSNISERISHT